MNGTAASAAAVEGEIELLLVEDEPTQRWRACAPEPTTSYASRPKTGSPADLSLPHQCRPGALSPQGPALSPARTRRSRTTHNRQEYNWPSQCMEIPPAFA
jgi:hypothetical protein